MSGTIGTYMSSEYLAVLNRMVLTLRHRLKSGYQGARRARGKGGSLEFSDFRDYAPGDDVRRLDWNSYARFDKLFIKMFMEERQATVNIFLDCSASMGCDEGAFDKLTYGKLLAASLAYICVNGADRVSLFAIINGNVAKSLTNITTKLRFSRIIDFLDTVSAGGKTDFTNAFALPLGNGGLSVIISDFFTENVYESAKKLAISGQMVSFIHILSVDEENPEPEGKFRLRDSETGESLDMDITPDIVEKYKKSLQNFIQSVKTECERLNGLYVFTTPRDNPTHILGKFI